MSLAAAACGANPVPINWHWREREIAHVLRDSGARLVFAHSPHVPDVEAALGSIDGGGTRGRGADAAGTHGRGCTGRHDTLDDWIARASEPLPYQDGAIADSMGMIYTSGTTGRPKGVLRDRMTAQQLLSIAVGTAQRMGLRPGGTMMVAGPLYHTSPNALALLALRMGTDIVVMPQFDPREFLDAGRTAPGRAGQGRADDAVTASFAHSRGAGDVRRVEPDPRDSLRGSLSPGREAGGDRLVR